MCRKNGFRIAQFTKVCQEFLSQIKKLFFISNIENFIYKFCMQEYHKLAQEEKPKKQSKHREKMHNAVQTHSHCSQYLLKPKEFYFSRACRKDVQLLIFWSRKSFMFGKWLPKQKSQNIWRNLFMPIMFWVSSKFSRKQFLFLYIIHYIPFVVLRHFIFFFNKVNPQNSTNTRKKKPNRGANSGRKVHPQNIPNIWQTRPIFF